MLLCFLSCSFDCSSVYLAHLFVCLFLYIFVNQLMDYGADVNCQDYEGRVPLMWACHWGNIKLVETLVDYHKHYIMSCHKRHKLAIPYYAIRREYEHITDGYMHVVCQYYQYNSSV